jgi:hypothetical protein
LPPEVVRILHSSCIAHLATSVSDVPHVTPVWVDYDNAQNQIVVNVESTTKKLRNVQVNRNVGLSLVDRSNDDHWVSIGARVVGITADSGAVHLQTLAVRYLGRHKRHPGKRCVLMEVVRYHWWGEWDG